MKRRRLAVPVAALALFGVGFVLASCGGDEESVTTTETTPQTTTETQPTIATDPTPDEGPAIVTIVVENGAPVGGIVREAVEKGDRVVLTVRSDVSDHVHLHGYDIVRDVAPGSLARLRFRATIPGRFEVELEDRGLQIADITVQP